MGINWIPYLPNTIIYKRAEVSFKKILVGNTKEGDIKEDYLTKSKATAELFFQKNSSF